MPSEVTIRGITYPSHTAAGKAIGVTRSSITAAVKRKTLATVGQKNRGHAGKPVEIGEFKFPTRAACDAYLGASQGYTANVLRRGTVNEKRTLIRKLLRTKAEKEMQDDVSRSAA